MCSWTIKVAEACIPLKNLLRREFFSEPLINSDKTTLQVLKEPGSSPNSKSFMWVFRSGYPHALFLYFHYHQKRKGDITGKFLDDYKGIVQTDGYVAYNFLDHRDDITHLGCFAHTRRKFMEAQKQELTSEELLELRQREAKPILDQMYAWLSKKSFKVVPKS